MRFTAASLLLLVAAPATAQVTAPRTANVSADGATQVRISAAAGFLKVRGVRGATTVTVDGVARAPNGTLLDQVVLIAERRGSVVHVEARVPEWSQPMLASFRGEQFPALDMTIVVPAGVAVKASDGSGEAEFRSLSSLELNDASGSVVVEDVLTSVDVTDGSGDLTVRNVAGPVKVHDGSGSVTIESTGGPIEIEDGSGEIVVRDATHVVIRDGSGGIHVSGASGNVRIDNDGSGGIAVRDVNGDFTVIRGRRGSVTHSGVRGRVTIPGRSD